MTQFISPPGEHLIIDVTGRVMSTELGVWETDMGHLMRWRWFGASKPLCCLMMWLAVFKMQNTRPRKFLCLFESRCRARGSVKRWYHKGVGCG